MPIQQGGKSHKLTASQKKMNAATAVKVVSKSPTAKKLTAEQFARNQLKKAGIKPGTGDVKAQFRALNDAAVKKRRAAGLGRASTVGASSALAAGNKTANPKVQKKRAAKAKLKRLG